jgi:hypothetical protein
MAHMIRIDGHHGLRPVDETTRIPSLDLDTKAGSMARRWSIVRWNCGVEQSRGQTWRNSF